MDDAEAPPSPAATDSIYAQYASTRDAVVGGPVTKDTTLATLCGHENVKRPQQRLVKDLSGVSTFAIPCRMHIEDDSQEQPFTTVPLRSTKSSGCEILFRFVNGFVAPAVRVEFRFIGPGRANTREVRVACLDFHFNNCEGKQLSDFRFTTDHRERLCDIDFIVNGATCEGFIYLEQSVGQQDETLDILRSLIGSGHKRTIHLELLLQETPQREEGALYNVLKRLPTGNGPLLPSIGHAEYQNFATFQAYREYRERRDMRLNELCDPYTLMHSTPPLPFVPLPHGMVYSSKVEYASRMRMAISSQHYENQKSLEFFARATGHKVVLFRVNDLVVIGMKFDPNMRKIGGIDARKFISLANEMEIQIHIGLDIRVPEGEDCRYPIRAYLEKQPMGLPKSFDAFFVVTSHEIRDFGVPLHTAKDTSWKDLGVYAIRPHKDSFLFDSLLEAIDDFSEADRADLDTILLNQRHSEIPLKDFTTGLKVSEKDIDRAKTWLRGCQPWNQHQRQAIEDMFRSRGGIQLISGAPGTDETTLMLAQAIFFVMLGGRALCTAPANVDADRWMEQAREMVDSISGFETSMLRLYSSTKGVSFKQLCRETAKHKRAGHSGGSVADIESLMFELLKANGAEAPSMSVEMSVLREAEKREYKLRVVSHRGEDADAWEMLRRYLSAIRDGSFNWKDKEQRRLLDWFYQLCKKHLIQCADIVFITSGNVRSSELDIWAAAEPLEGESTGKTTPPVKKIAALGVFVSGAARDSEINILNVLTTCGLPRKADLTVMAGDTKQLSPPNKCEMKRFQTNPCMEELDISLFERLESEGFPCSRLLTQVYMSKTLIDFPNRKFYNGQLQNGPDTDACLDPAFSKVLRRIISRLFTEPWQGKRYLKRATDAQARLRWFQMPVVAESEKHFGDRTNNEGMLLIGYTNALVRYQDELRKHQESSQLPDSHYPKVLTIDAAHGLTTTMAIVDGSMQWAEPMGFMKDERRSNVAMTRATEVLWIIGGPMTSKYGKRKSKTPPPFAELKFELEKTRQAQYL
ncbi:hypothetical protein CBER1_04415 [Cercospora berteroae]|uniref:DNA2/NAM7 helicase-like C-terminal domain-containing protein n=1 Tax=Cercospora berteroae TaxID=357750 RepID=A0A2S6CCP9_9PEZI|nr:hypothetical protein CBER1_04415 [Cercospora berteroae]